MGHVNEPSRILGLDKFVMTEAQTKLLEKDVN